jgi:hypothetical protein
MFIHVERIEITLLEISVDMWPLLQTLNWDLTKIYG